VALSEAEIRQLAKDAGFHFATQLDTAVGIAFAESGGNPNAHNTKGRDDSYGLWQINMKGALGPQRRKRFGITSDAQLFDPLTNARAAHKVYLDSGWKAWTTYRNGDYITALDLHRKAPHLPGPPNINVPNPVAGIADVGTSIKQSVNTIGENMLRVGYSLIGVLLAATLLLAGIAILIVNSGGHKKIIALGKKVM
jgi:hypothetical protein